MKTLLIILFLGFTTAQAASDLSVVASLEHAMEERVDDEKIVIITNPVKSGTLKLRLDDSTSTNIKVSIINSLGEQVYVSKRTGVSKLMTYDIAALRSGIYFLRVHTDQSTVVKKLIIQ